MKCNNEKCKRPATLQFEHNGKLIFYCKLCFEQWKVVMSAMGAFVPITYPIGTKTLDI